MFFVNKDAHLQGDVNSRASCALFSRLERSGFRNALGDGSFAVLDKYLSELGPGAAASIHEPQWRNQYVARQRQLDAGTRGDGEKRIVWR